jgi:type IV fimbrial biogenesis protein FimT
MRAARGFTLVELMITVGIVAILLSVAVPSYKYVTNANRIASEVNGLLGDLQLARAEAIKQGEPVTVCVSADGATCTGGTIWSNGWIIFVDTNGNASKDAGESIVRVQQPFKGTDTFDASNGASAFTFNREGIAVNVANGALLKLSDVTQTTNWTRCLSITRVGMVWTQMYGTTVNGVTCS